MKRLLSVVLLLSLLLTLGGCRRAGEQATFYYRRAHFAYGTLEQDGVIASEQRSIEGHSGNLSYLIPLYLAGPLDEKLNTVYPPDIQLIHVYQTGQTLFVTLTELDRDFNPAQFSLASACLALTCLGLTDAQEVNIVCGEWSITLSCDDLTLMDDVADSQFMEE